MPILDVELVVGPDETLADDLAAQLADAAGAIFASPPGNTWVRVRTLDRRSYAENGTTEPAGQRAVFVTVLRAVPPEADVLAAEVQALTSAIARICGRPPENVHTLYDPPAAGRIAFGGTLRQA